MKKNGWSPVPPKFLRRWAIQGHRPNGDIATTLFDVTKDREHVAVYPATLDTFAVLIDNFAMKLLCATLESHDAGVVPAWHAVHGDRLLGLSPFDLAGEPTWTNRPANAPPYQGPMVLYVRLPKSKIEIVYARDRLLELRNALAEIVDWTSG